MPVDSGTILDVMPLDERILGFSNRWYRVAMEAATEDLIFVIDGRSTIVEEAQAERSLLREYLQTEVAGLLAAPGFIDALPGYLLPDAASQARIGTVLRRLKAVTSP